MISSKEKNTKDKNTITIHKILHKILEAIKLFYEICKVLKAILKLFFWWLCKVKSRCDQASAFLSLCFLSIYIIYFFYKIATNFTKLPKKSFDLFLQFTLFYKFFNYIPHIFCVNLFFSWKWKNFYISNWIYLFL